MLIPPWVNTAAGTWSAKAKAAVEGPVDSQGVVQSDAFRRERSADRQRPARPFGHVPGRAVDPAFAYNPDEGSITADTIRLSLPVQPDVEDQPQCEAGTVGIAVNGIPILDGFDAGGNDAGGVETRTRATGTRTTSSATTITRCRRACCRAPRRRTPTQVGWSLDGFGIYVEQQPRASC